MLRGFFYSAHPLLKLIISIIVIFTFGIVSSLIGIYLAGLIQGLDTEEMLRLMQGNYDMADVSFLQVMQITQSVGMFIIPPIFLAYLFSPKGMNYIGISNSTNIQTIILAVILILSSIPFINFLSEINQKVTFPGFLSEFENTLKKLNEEYEKLLNKFLQFDSVKQLSINIIMIGIIPAIGEEFTFRGILQNLFTEWTKRKHLAVFITAIIFSSIHLQFYGFLPRLILGLFLGYLYLWSRSIWIPVVAHFVNNTMAVIYFYLLNTGKFKIIDLETIGTTKDMVYSAIFSGVLVIIILYGIFTIEKRYNHRKT